MLMLLQHKHGLVAGDDSRSIACNGAFKNAVIRFVLKDVESFNRTDNRTKVCQINGTLLMLLRLC
jgi:hypothetical protein